MAIKKGVFKGSFDLLKETHLSVVVAEEMFNGYWRRRLRSTSGAALGVGCDVGVDGSTALAGGGVGDDECRSTENVGLGVGVSAVPPRDSTELVGGVGLEET